MIKNINKLIVANLIGLSLISSAYAEFKAPTATMAASSQSAGKLITGVVKETMNAGGYTYLLLNAEGETKWVAGPKTQVKVGDKISISQPMAMENFTSKVLARQFKVIYFTGQIIVGDGKNMKPSTLPHQSIPKTGMPQMTMPNTGMPELAKSKVSSPQVKKDPHIDKVAADSSKPNDHVSTSTKKSEPLKGIKKAKNGKTINDVLKQKKDLAGKSVKIRGKVIKFTAEVMNKNWIHIKDSSTGGDLTITTSAKAKIGDTIVVDGKIAVNKDFGFGYIYDVILEDAKITIE
ncbi:hypothetical protein MNBD_GAMMA22-2445 [hydrothermal vent metagenome]|uniref:NrfJ n=1 Tax=hydrothermal vent metagenome TaxID=652676 RepID=A0A3B1A9L3_9ZZZZ